MCKQFLIKSVKRSTFAGLAQTGAEYDGAGAEYDGAGAEYDGAAGAYDGA